MALWMKFSMSDPKRFTGYLIRFNGPDLMGEEFTPETEISFPELPAPLRFLAYGEERSMIGQVESADKTPEGYVIQGTLDIEKLTPSQIEMIRAGIYRLASASTPQLAEIDDDGFIKRWPVTEAYMTVLPAAEGTQIELVEESDDQEEADTQDG